MAFSAAERQAKRRTKLITKGKVLFQAWVTQAQAERIRALLGGVTYHAPATPARRKRRKLDPVQEKNRELFEAHQAEIRARRAAGEKPSQLVAWPERLWVRRHGRDAQWVPEVADKVPGPVTALALGPSDPLKHLGRPRKLTAEQVRHAADLIEKGDKGVSEMPIFTRLRERRCTAHCARRRKISPCRKPTTSRNSSRTRSPSTRASRR